MDATYDKIIKNFKHEAYCDNNGFRNDHVEFRIITLMLCINHATTHKIMESECFELAIATDRIIVALDDLSVCSQLKKDIIALNKRFKETINFTHKIVCEKYPRMLFPTKFDDTIPSTSIKAYPNQIELVNKIKQNPEILIILKTMIGGGKTTLVGALAVHTQNVRTLEKASPLLRKEQTQLLFVCSVETVREQVGKIVWNMGIGLAIATLDSKSGLPKITKNYNCDKKDEKIVVILSDISSGLLLLKTMKDENKKYIVFFDEPTVGADQPNHPITNTIPQFLKYSPSQFILCSATIPDVNQIPKTVKIFTDAHPDAAIEIVTSKTSYIGCEIVAPTGQTITPHANCESVDKLKYIIKRINEQPFIGRLYTAPIVYKMHVIMSENNVPNLPSIDDYFNNVRNHSQNKVQEFAIILLNCLIATNNNELIKTVCVPISRINIVEDIKETCDENSDDSDDDGMVSFESDSEKDEDENVPVHDYIQDITKLSTTLAHEFMGGCLIASSSPVLTVEAMHKASVDKSFRLKNVLSNFESQKKKLATQLSNIDKRKVTQDTRQGNGRDDRGSRDDNVENKDYRAKKKQELEENSGPVFAFPGHYQINTLSHLKQYSNKPIESYDPNMIRSQVCYTEHDVEIFNETIVPDWMMTEFVRGIGVYDPENPIIDKVYLDKVLMDAESGHLAFLSGGHSIAYGTNFPLSSVIATDDLCDAHSMNTLFQLINRAGRVGKSWKAKIILGANTIKRIEDFILGKICTGTSEEAINMELSVDRMLLHDAKIKLEEEQKLVAASEKAESIRLQEVARKTVRKEEIKSKPNPEQHFIVSLRDLSVEDKRELPPPQEVQQWSRGNFRNDGRDGRDNRDNYRRDSRDNRDGRDGRDNRDNFRRDFRNRDNSFRNNNSFDKDRSSGKGVSISNTQPVPNEDVMVTKYKELKSTGKYIPVNIKNNPKVKEYIASL